MALRVGLVLTNWSRKPVSIVGMDGPQPEFGGGEVDIAKPGDAFHTS
jgi:hypothetical protein